MCVRVWGLSVTSWVCRVRVWESEREEGVGERERARKRARARERARERESERVGEREIGRARE